MSVARITTLNLKSKEAADTDLILVEGSEVVLTK